MIDHSGDPTRTSPDERHSVACLARIFRLMTFLAVLLMLGADDDKKSAADRSTPAWKAAIPSFAEREAMALAFVGEHHPDLAVVLEPLKSRNSAEYRKAIGDLSQTARNLAELKSRNPKRYTLSLNIWKAKTQVELLAAKLASSPEDQELRSQLRSAIEAKVDADIQRQKFDLAQAEAAARRFRLSLDRLENHKDEVVETRFRALQPRKSRKAKRLESSRPAAVPSTAVQPEARP
ncbi:hypothetical protein P12x_001413 [Tundrisphaera lichenicola]|uniref:hypothetical protein n=1 Tax=Tundrisphaera lichenicola TaxID=2029860 RepID=UPI003EBEC2E1